MLDSRSVYNYTLPRRVLTNAYTREQGIANRPLQELRLIEFLHGKQANWALRPIAHGKPAFFEMFRSRGDAIFASQLLRAHSKVHCNLLLDCMRSRSLFKCLGQHKSHSSTSETPRIMHWVPVTRLPNPAPQDRRFTAPGYTTLRDTPKTLLPMHYKNCTTLMTAKTGRVQSVLKRRWENLKAIGPGPGVRPTQARDVIRPIGLGRDPLPVK